MNAEMLERVVEEIPGAVRYGNVTKAVGLIIEASFPSAFIGELCTIYPHRGDTTGIKAEVVGFRGDTILLMPFEKCLGIGPGATLKASGESVQVRVGDSVIGRVLDAFGQPIDGGSKPQNLHPFSLQNFSRNPMHREAITDVLATGVKALDSVLTMGKGQRMALMAGSGVGKSTLLSSLCANVDSDVNVVALIGERGREVEEFVNRTLGEKGLQNSVVIAATAQEPPLVRVHAAYSAMAIAEYFAAQGKNVFFTMDSITRFATALREIGLAIGEPPTIKGYTPSVFSVIPEMLERCGNFRNSGSISAIFTVLVESDDFNDPLVDNVRAILDGHIVLTRELAQQNHFPAIDIPASISRLFNQLADASQNVFAKAAREIFTDYQNNRDFIELNLLEHSDTSKSDKLIEKWQLLSGFLLQDVDETSSFAETKALFVKLLEELQYAPA